ncbi:defensin-like protein 1 isoform X2 [Lycium ferocissimum]|uniref:defensin-like protein 1 isoform X2 n=1 Tax=Lycium ferocissimum TaxID=112874 RepID=UPI00281654AB|nr:defensin-like protein 1 isoform X2 [Lycium ferocissimum]
MNNKVILAFLFCFLLIASNGGEAKVCQRRSKTWSGPCINTGNCSRQCKNQEDARFGACHRNGFGFACFCYFNC